MPKVRRVSTSVDQIQGEFCKMTLPQPIFGKLCRTLFLAACLGLAMASGALAAVEASPPPPPLAALMNVPVGDDAEEVAEAEREKAGAQIRFDALREAALSYGARAGLANRTFEIQRRLAEQETYLSKVYGFNRLLIPTANGLLIEPPIVTEALQALIVKGGGQEAAVADRVLKINRAARIVTAPRDWRTYLERDWGAVEPPPALLLPKDEEELVAWREGVEKGWQAGLEQADEIFQADLDRLTNDFTGMVRYRDLLAQGMITAPFALAENRGITGNPNEMRIGDRGVEITGPSQFVIKGSEWQPAPR